MIDKLRGRSNSRAISPGLFYYVNVVFSLPSPSWHPHRPKVRSRYHVLMGFRSERNVEQSILLVEAASGRIDMFMLVIDILAHWFLGRKYRYDISYYNIIQWLSRDQRLSYPAEFCLDLNKTVYK